MKAVKENKVYTINEAQQERYLKEGFDIYDDEGNVLDYSPKKKVLYSEYAKLLKENAELKAKLEDAGTKKKKSGE